ncbi:MAG: D-alanyl-D-alanine carboxypeptidase/D-alanyl-D-alanine endopeptidase, partial [Blastocatellia bacterium]
SLDSGKVIYEHDARTLMVPASNAKLFTAALALDRLGPDFRIQTSVYSASPPDRRGSIRGDVLVYGRGDPTFAAGADQDPYAPLENLALEFEKSGVRKIYGDLIGDESYFRGAPYGSGWEWNDFQWYYGAEVSALSINDNAIKLDVVPGARPGSPCRIETEPSTPLVTLVNMTTTGPAAGARTLGVYRAVGENTIYVWGGLPIGDPGYGSFVAIHNPALLFVSMLKEVLARHGIVVTGKVRTIDWKYRMSTPAGLSRLNRLAEVSSPPLAEIVKETLKPSQNLYAQLLLLEAGMSPPAGSEGAASTSSMPVPAGMTQTTEEAGLTALKLFLAKAGVDTRETLIEEGAGLSRSDLVTANAVVTLLGYVHKREYAGVLTDALPIAAADGTLRNRMKSTVAAGNVKAKTGTLHFDHALSGYVTTVKRETLAFSIIVNNYSNQEGRFPSTSDIDRIAELLAGFSGRS